MIYQHIGAISGFRDEQPRETLTYRMAAVPRLNRCFLLLAGNLLAACLALPLHAEESVGSTPTKSGWRSVGGWADSVQEDLALDDLHVGSVFRPPLLDGTLQPWFDAKRKINEKLGLQLQFSYQALYQAASESSTTEDEAAAGRAEAQGIWTLLGRDTKNPVRWCFGSRTATGSERTFPHYNLVESLGAQA